MDQLVLLEPPITDVVTLWRNNPLYTKETRLWRFKLDGSEYTRLAEIATSKKGRKKLSKVWDWGEELVREDKRHVYYCYECEVSGFKQQFPAVNGTTGAANHLKTYHNRDPKTGQLLDSDKPREETTLLKEVVRTHSFEVFKLLLVKWFVFCQLALFMLENRFFRAFVSYLHEGLGEYLPKASSTLRGWILSLFLDQKEALKKELASSITKVHISFDIWTASNQRGYIAVWGYWINAQGTQQRRMLAFRRIYRSHTGENQAEVLYKVLKEYNLQHNLGFTVSDNASSNDAAVSLLLKELEPSITNKAIAERRLRCFGHIVNLAAQSLLTTTGAEAKKAARELESIEDDAEDEEGDTEEVRARWMHSGPLGKLQRLVRYVLASGQRREEFAAISGGVSVKKYDHLGLIQDNSTRWNSMFLALTRALNTKERLIKFRAAHKPAANAKWKPKDENLTPSDWYHFEKIHGCLESFYAATMTTEGHKPLLTEWFQSLHALMGEIWTWEVEARDELSDPALELALHAAWLKIEKYYKLADDMPVYYAAIILDPTLKDRWLAQIWTDDKQRTWIKPTVDKVRAMWSQYRVEHYYEPLTASADDDAFTRMRSLKRLRLDASLQADQFEQYITSDPLLAPAEPARFNVIEYWIQRRQGWPQLAQFALDVLSVPVMSDDNERSFSAAKDMINDRRNRLCADIIEASQCLRSWLQVNEKEPLKAAFDATDTADKADSENELDPLI